MASMLDLPRELYLMICSYLSPRDMAILAGVTRDHYLAVQQPIYEQIKITAYASLIKLVDTLCKVPVVSHISLQQRLRWFKLSDAQLRERDIKHLELIIDFRKDGAKITGAILANCVGAISRKCFTSRIKLTLSGMPPEFVRQLERFGLPSVSDLSIFMDSNATVRGSGQNRQSSNIWDFVFSGAAFPDLKGACIDTGADYENVDSFDLFASIHPADSHLYGNDEHHKVGPTDVAPYYGLRNMERITLSRNMYLDVPTLKSLFSSEIIPVRLTRLEIVDCPKLHAVKHLKALSTLLQRALHLVQSLKLHLCRFEYYDEDETFLDSRYAARIDDHPEEHFCNIIRELGHKVRNIDLAVPFVCDRMFQPVTKVSKAMDSDKAFPSIPLRPISILSNRVMSEGFKHRRIICGNGVCRRAHTWDDMVLAANETKEQSSWLLLYIPRDRASWHLSGCSEIRLTASDALLEELPCSDDSG